MLKNCASWRLAFAGQEKVTARLRRAMRDLGLPKLELISVYGPVEVTISCSRVRLGYQKVSEDFSDVTGENFCGKMMPNYSLVIMDRDLQPAPVGYPGEICIAGPGLAKGYLNDADGEAQKFINNPFASPDDVSEGRTRLLRSGDKGRVLEDGSVHFIGRIESGKEVKIRDKRVNLDEIADVVVREASPAVLDAAVSWREGPGVLLAFVTLADESVGNADAFLRKLNATVPLPTHMIPDAIIPVHSLPKTLNGRKDFDAFNRLPLPEVVSGRMTTESFSPLEMTVKGIWEKLVPTDGVPALSP